KTPSVTRPTTPPDPPEAMPGPPHRGRGPAPGRAPGIGPSSRADTRALPARSNAGRPSPSNHRPQAAPGGPPSDLVTGMHGDDAAAHVHVAAARQPGFFHHRLQLFLRRMLADALGQVLVAGRIAGEQAAELRQDLERVEVVDRLEPLRAHF